MASITSEERQCSTYIKARAVVDYSGTSATAHIQYIHTAGGYTGYGGSFSYGAGSASNSGSWSGERIGPDWETKMSISFPISMSGGTYKIWCSGYDYIGFEVNVNIPAQYTAPTGLAISNIRPGIDSITATCDIDSWGRPDGSSSSYRELNVSSSGSDQLRRFQKVYGSSKTGDITVTNSSEVLGGMTINPNTMYYLWEYATNGQVGVAGSYTGYSTVTLPPALTAKSAEVLSYKEIKISFTTAFDGGRYAKTIQYSLDNSTWVDGTTVSSGSATSGNFTISDLKAGTNYTIYLRVKTTAGTTTSGSVTARTKSVVKIIRNNQVIEALPFLIKPDGTKIELNVRRV